ncbi:senescence superfamily domain-containing protein [Histoplasma ohiense]|nr:senescence superfamily domain-containing protein [Histoplasma ohiense (nom. inval.)]
MSRGPYDPRLFFSIDNIRAFHIQNGEESELTTSGPQTLSLLMVPTSCPSTDPELASQPPEDDFYLHLHLPPELDLPLPATTQIYHQPPNSYLIPRWDLGPNAGAFTRIEFPSIGSGPGKVSQEDVDTFETILAQCTAFLERSPPPKFAPYNPATYAPGEGYIGSGGEKQPAKRQPGQIVLVDEENGSVVGELTDSFNIVEDADVKHGSKNPVEIQLPTEGQGNNISVHNVSDEYLQTARHPAYAKSTIVQTSATASRLLVAGSAYIAKSIQSGANTFTQKTKPNSKPMTFTPTAQARMRRINTFSSNAAGLSSKTVSKVTKVAQNFGATIAGKKDLDSEPRGFDENGRPIYHSKPGILNKSLIAFSTIADGIDQGAKQLLHSGQLAATTVVGHRYGPEAAKFTSELTGGVKNVGLVYIDAAGVSRKAVLKSVAKGMVVGRMKDGQQIVVSDGDAPSVKYPGIPGQKPPPFMRSGTSQSLSGLTPGNAYLPRGSSPSPTPPPAYGSQSGRSLGGTTLRNGK